jgi:hypothetical protein
MKIIYVNHGLGNNFGDEIELNKNLLKPEYKNIHDAIIQHERSHSDKSFTFYDLKLDLSKQTVPSLDIIKFMIKYPKSFTQLLPVYWTRNRGVIYDINLILIYGFIISLGAITTYLALTI